MEELFRFSVVRATTKSTPNVTTLAEPTPVTGTPGRVNTTPQTFQQQLHAALQEKPGDTSTNENIWSRLEPIAAKVLTGSAATILGNPLWADLNGLLNDLHERSNPTATAAVNEASLSELFASRPNLTADSATKFRTSLSDLFIALLIVRRAGPTALEQLAHDPALRSIMPLLGGDPTLIDVAALIGAADLVVAGPASLAPDLTLDAAASRAALLAAITHATTTTLLIPPGIFTPLNKPVLGVGFREFHVVKQNIRRYRTAEIGRIENILKGESRTHWQSRALSTETDTTTSSSATSDTAKELDTSDHTDIKNEVNEQAKSDTKLDAGVHAEYSKLAYKLQADLHVSYAHSDTNTRQYSADTAKDVTQKSVSKVTEVITHTQTTRLIETFRDRERQAFNNTNGTTNVSGIYQWIEKIYLSQVFNLGRHMLLDITVPEPAANLLAMAMFSEAESTPPQQPHPLGSIITDAAGVPVLDRYGRMQLKLPLNPLDLSPDPFIGANQPNPNFYGTWVALYGVTSVSPPPDKQRTFSKPKAFDYEDNSDKTATDQIAIDDGYAATELYVSVTAMRNDDPEGGVSGDNIYVNVTVGGQNLHLPWQGGTRSRSLSSNATIHPAATGNVGFAIYGRQIDQMNVSIELVAMCLPSKLDEWKLQTYEKIVAAYNAVQQNYEAELAARKMATQTVGPLGSKDETANRLTEREELKRSCIAIMDHNNLTVSGRLAAVQLNPLAAVQPPDPAYPQLPEPILAISQLLGARVRWFEQAFEWENVAYVFYPYYWGRRGRWVPDLALTNDDPIFLSFLRSGYARVVVPVRLGFETAVQFYLNTGLPWLGGGLPPIGDSTQNPLYLDVAEEIKTLTGGGETGEIETPVGDPWEYVLPTTLMKLKDGDSLPEWHRDVPAGDVGSEWASDAPDSSWTWKDGPPA